MNALTDQSVLAWDHAPNFSKNDYQYIQGVIINDMADTRRETIEIVRQDGISMAVMKLDYSQVPVHIQIGSGTSSSAKPWNYEKFDPELAHAKLTNSLKFAKKNMENPLLI